MTTAELARALESYADAKNRHDLQAVVDLLAEGAAYEDTSSGMTIEGKQALRNFFAQLFDDLPDYYGRFDGVAYGERNTAVVWGHWGGTLRESLMGFGVEAGRQLKVPVTFVCTFNDDGLLTRDIGYFDSGTVRRQAGLSTEAPARVAA